MLTLTGCTITNPFHKNLSNPAGRCWESSNCVTCLECRTAEMLTDCRRKAVGAPTTKLVQLVCWLLLQRKVFEVGGVKCRHSGLPKQTEAPRDCFLRRPVANYCDDGCSREQASEMDAIWRYS